MEEGILLIFSAPEPGIYSPFTGKDGLNMSIASATPKTKEVLRGSFTTSVTLRSYSVAALWSSCSWSTKGDGSKIDNLLPQFRNI